MRILLINNCHYRRGGADVVYLNTGKLLERNGHQVYYFSQKNINNEANDFENYFINQVYYFNNSFLKRIFLFFRFFYSFEASRKLRLLLRDFHPEIAHIHYYKGTVTPSVLKVLKEHKIPVVQTLHDYGLICPHNSCLDGNSKICLRCYNSRIAFNCVIHRCNHRSYLLSFVSYLEYIFHSLFIPFGKYIDHFITVNDFAHKLYEREDRYRNKMTRIYNFDPFIFDQHNDINFNGYFLFLGRLSGEKGILTLINAWKEIKTTKCLMILGDGPQKNEIERIIFESKVGNVIMAGFQSGMKLRKAIKEAFFIIVPSEINENNPLAIVESYSNGIPVIASDVGGIPEIVVEGETGYLFQMANPIELREKINMALDLTKEQYSDICDGAFDFANRNFDKDVHYKQLISVYNKVIIDGKIKGHS